jgi:Tfp pilus assembly protein PilF
MKTISRLLLGVVLVVLPTTVAMAQQARIDGELYGRDGEAIAGATILLDEIGGNRHYEIQGGDRGDFVHLSVGVGRYQLILEFDGRPQAIAEVRIGTGSNPMKLDLQRLEIENMEFSGDLGTQISIIRDITLIGENEIVTIPSENPFDNSEDREEAQAADTAMREAFDAGRAALEAEDYDEAIAQFTIAVEGSPTPQHVIYANLALAYERARRFDEAAENFELAQETAFAQGVLPATTNYYTNLTLIYANAGDVDKALENAEKAVEFDSEGAGLSFFNIGVVLTNAGQTTAAIGIFERAVDVDPEMADALYQLGLAYLGVPDRISDAVEVMERYLELRPDGPDAETARQLLEFARQ